MARGEPEGDSVTGGELCEHRCSEKEGFTQTCRPLNCSPPSKCLRLFPFRFPPGDVAFVADDSRPACACPLNPFSGASMRSARCRKVPDANPFNDTARAPVLY
jgi:hypothetical protein